MSEPSVLRFAPARLSSITVRALSVRTVDPFRIATGEVHATRSVLVTATLTRAGRSAVGLGEGACLPPVTREDQPDALAAVEAALSVLVDRELGDEASIHAALDAVLAATPVARSAVEVAVLSALASLDELPLWRWLSGERSGPLPRIETDITLPILAPERMAELAAHWWGIGFRDFKVKVGRNLADDLASLARVAKVVPLARFQPDANAGLSVEEALAYAEAARVQGLHITCFEQPCATLAELRSVAEALALPVIADESVKSMADLDALIAAGAADGVNLKIAKSGSLLRALAIGRAARQRHMPLMVGGMMETRLGMTTAAHLAAALGGVEFADLDTAWLLDGDPFSGGYRAERLDDATRPGPLYRLPELPGLGVLLT